MLSKIKNQSCLFFVFFLCTFLSHAQEIYIETGYGSAFFENYINSSGDPSVLDDSYSQPMKPFTEVGFRFNLYKEKIHLNLGAGYHTYEINTAFSAGGTKVPTSYNLSYASSKLGIQMAVLKWRDVKLHVHSHVSHDWLTAGTNQYNGVLLDIYNDRSLDRTLVRIHRGISLEYAISNSISAYLNYNFAQSMEEQDKDSREGESYSFETKSISVGLLFNINHA
jgi:hypothetical protein